MVDLSWSPIGDDIGVLMLKMIGFALCLAFAADCGTELSKSRQEMHNSPVIAEALESVTPPVAVYLPASSL